MEIAAWIRKSRAYAGLTQAQAADKFGVHRTTWVRWESGTHRPEPICLMKIAAWSRTPLSVLELMLDADA